MGQKNELSRFQENMNWYAFYLFIMSIKCRNLEYHDQNGKFENYYSFMQTCKEKLSDLIDKDDKDLLLNHEPYKSFFENEKMPVYSKEKEIECFKNHTEIKNAYLDYSDTISISNLKFKRNMLWAIGMPLFVIFLLLAILLKENFPSFLEYPDKYCIVLSFLVLSLFLIIYAILLSIALKTTSHNSLKFYFLFNMGYCQRRINESKVVLENCINQKELFFESEKKLSHISKYNKEDDDSICPKHDNTFYKTIEEYKKYDQMENPKRLIETISEENFKDLYDFNENFCLRFLFSKFIEQLKEKTAEHGMKQQIAFFFAAATEKEHLKGKGNGGFEKLINFATDKRFDLEETTFNSAVSKYKDFSKLWPDFAAIFSEFEEKSKSIL